MIKNIENRLFQLLMLLTGIMAMGLRRILYLTAVDAKGLLQPFSVPEVALLALTVLILLFLLLMLPREKLYYRYEKMQWSGLPAALGHSAAAVCLLLTLRWGPCVNVGKMADLWQILGYASAACLFLAGMMRLLKKKPFFFLHVVFCIFLLIHVVIHARYWSSIPQMQDYVFALLGALAMAIFSYYTAALEGGCGNSRLFMGAGFATVYFCFAELAMTDYPWLYLGGMLWALTGSYWRKPAAAGKKG